MSELRTQVIHFLYSVIVRIHSFTHSPIHSLY